MSSPPDRACWWCGSRADSGEHKFKRSDLLRAFGGGSWDAANSVAHVVEGDSMIGLPRSSRADRLKFRDVLCRDCNSRRSQPFDKAYDNFADYLREHERDVVETAHLDWVEVFGDTWNEDLKLLVGYWVKHIGCRLVTDGVPVRAALAGYLDGRKPLAHIYFRLEIRDDIATAAAYLEAAHGIDPAALWLGPSEGEYSVSRGHIVRVWSHWGLGAIRLAYSYDWESAASSSNFHNQVVTLPRDFNVDPAEVVAECAECKLRD